jgi:drug/metabolite transporter (DMT)-like permease
VSDGAGRALRLRALSGYALVATAACSWGTWPIFLRRAQEIARPGGSPGAALQAAIVMIILTVVSGPFCLGDRIRARRNVAQWLGVGWLGVSDALNVLLLFAAYQRTSVDVAVLTHYLAPILVAMAAPFVLRERVRGRTLLAVALSFAGLVLLLRPWSADRRPGDWAGAALGAGSAVFYASNVLVNKRLTGAFSGSQLAFYHGLVASPLLAATVPPGAWAAVDPRALAVVGAGAVVAGALGGLFFVWGLRRIAASNASTLTLLEPLVAVTLAAVLLGERLAPTSGLGAVLILGGAAVVVSSGASHPRGPGSTDSAHRVC